MGEQAAAGLQTSTGEQDAARWLDAEDATMRQVLAWAMGHDTEVALQLAGALEFWWYLRGRYPGLYPLLAELTGCAEPGGARWCRAQQMAGWAATFSSNPDVALRHFTVLRDAVTDRSPSSALADALNGRAIALFNRDQGQRTEAAEEGRRALAASREAGYRLGEAVALVCLAGCAAVAGDAGGAVRLARRTEQVRDEIPPSIARMCSSYLAEMLIQADDLAAAERVCAAALAACRDAGDQWNLSELLIRMTLLDLRASRTSDAAAHLRESLQLSLQTATWIENYLDYCGHLCAATGRYADAVTAWAALAAVVPLGRIGRGTRGTGKNRCARPGRRWDRNGRGRPRNAARR